MDSEKIITFNWIRNYVRKNNRSNCSSYIFEWKQSYIYYEILVLGGDTKWLMVYLEGVMEHRHRHT